MIWVGLSKNFVERFEEMSHAETSFHITSTVGQLHMLDTPRKVLVCFDGEYSVRS